MATKRREVQSAEELLEWAHAHGAGNEVIGVTRGLLLRALEKGGMEDLREKAWITIAGDPKTDRVMGYSGKGADQKRWELCRYSKFAFMSSVTEAAEEKTP